MKLFVAIGLCLVALLPVARAQTATATYTYDALGRLTGSASTPLPPPASNQAPVAQDAYYVCDAHEKIIIHAWHVSTDPDGDLLTYDYVSQGALSNGNQTLTIWSSSTHGASIFINYTVSDGHGGTDSSVITLYSE